MGRSSLLCAGHWARFLGTAARRPQAVLASRAAPHLWAATPCRAPWGCVGASSGAVLCERHSLAVRKLGCFRKGPSGALHGGLWLWPGLIHLEDGSPHWPSPAALRRSPESVQLALGSGQIVMVTLPRAQTPAAPLPSLLTEVDGFSPLGLVLRALQGPS